MQRRSLRLRFPGSAGQFLAARLDRPVAEPLAYALFAHCFTCSKDHKAVSRISRTLAVHGFGVLRFDFTGLGESEGDFAGTDFSSNLADLIAAADFMGSHYLAPRVLIGHSLGGTAVLAAAPRIPGVTAVATIAAPSDTGHLRDLLLRRAPALHETGNASIRIGGREFSVSNSLLEDLGRDHVSGSLAQGNRALMILHSPSDRVVEIENAHRLFEAARHPKCFISLAGADHLLDKEADAKFAAEVLAAWARRYAVDLTS